MVVTEHALVHHSLEILIKLRENLLRGLAATLALCNFFSAIDGKTPVFESKTSLGEPFKGSILTAFGCYTPEVIPKIIPSRKNLLDLFSEDV